MLLKNESLYDRIFSYSLMAVPFTFPFAKFGVLNLTIILLVLVWLFSGKIFSVYRSLSLNKLALLFVSAYLVYVVALIYSEDMKAGLFLLEKKVTLLIFPLIFITTSLTQDQFIRIFFSFVYSCLLATIVSYIFVISVPFPLDTSKNDWYRDILIDFMDLHPTYFGMYIAFSIVFLFIFLLTKWRVLFKWQRGGVLTILLYFLVFLLFLSSRIATIAVFVSMIAVCYLFWMRNIKFTIVLAAGMLAVGVFLSSKVESIGGRFKEIFVTAWTPPVGIYHNSTNLRIGVYFCSIPLLKDNWLIGLGTGDVQAALNACYKERGYSDVMYKDQLNTHNEYLNVWLNTGIVGFIVFLATLVIPCRAAYLKHNYFYLSFIILVMIVFLTENVLERQKGIVFYSFFNSLLAFNLSIFHLPSPSRDHE